MKKIILISMIAIAAMGMIGCGEDDESKADVKWTNNSGTAIKDIVWISGGKTDQVWAGDVSATTGSETAFKEIKELAGEGDCVDSEGAAATITLDPSSTGVAATSGSSAVIIENATANLIISGVAKK